MSSYQQKLADRVAGRVSVQTYPSGPKPGTPAFEKMSPEQRYQAKLAARLAPKPAAEPAAEPEAKPEAEPEPEAPKPQKYGKRRY